MNYIIMAAGLSTRMGTDKMFIKVGGLSLVERQLACIRKFGCSNSINLVINKMIHKRYPDQLSRLVKLYGVNLLVSKYDPSTTTNSATMSYALNYGIFNSNEDTIVVDSDLYFSSDDVLDNIIKSDNKKLVTYSLTEVSEDDSRDEYLVDAKGNLYTEYVNYKTLYVMRSLYKINHKFLEVINTISENDGMKLKYFDDYILRSLGSTIPSFIITDKLKEFDNLKDILSSGLLSLDEVRELIVKAGLHKDDRGMSNTSFFSDDLFIKIFNKDTSSIVDRLREIKTQKVFESYGLSPKTYISTELYNVAEAIHGLHPSKETITSSNIKSILESISKIHNHKLSDNELSSPDKMMDQVKLYKDRIKVNLSDIISTDTMSQIEDIITDLDTDKPELCHGDLVKENILITTPTGSVKFIDFEYSCIRNHRWDLATLQIELGIISSDRRVDLYEVAVDYIWFLWSMMHDKIDRYYDYGISRLDRCLKNLNN